MKIVQTDNFNKFFHKLPLEIQRLYQIQEQRFQENYRDTRLHIKPVKSLPSAFSLRITRRYRAFFYFQNSETAIFFEIDHRKDIYQ